jgi:glycosidase
MRSLKKLVMVLALCVTAGVMESPLRGEAMLQYFNTSWAEITRKMPELAEAGYSSLWLPPPTKGSGGLSVGYDLWDPYDLGGKDQRSTVRTRYGTEAELLELVRTAHRFGIRVYFDNIMNHRAFDIPGYNENTPIDIYPGMVPEDFHLRVTQEGFYRKWGQYPRLEQRLAGAEPGTGGPHRHRPGTG